MVWPATANVPCSSLKKLFWAMATQAATSPFRIDVAAVTGALFRENERGASALDRPPIFCAVHLDDERRFHHLRKVPEDGAKLKGLWQALSLEASATALNFCFVGSRSAAPGVFMHTPWGAAVQRSMFVGFALSCKTRHTIVLSRLGGFSKQRSLGQLKGRSELLERKFAPASRVSELFY